MKKTQNNSVNTRMIKYNALRCEVEKEIKSLKLQAENLIKIKEYKKKINNIDASIVEQSNKIAMETFPDVSSIIYTERENTKNSLMKIKAEINKSKEIVQKQLPKPDQLNLTIGNFIPELENENLINQQIAENKKESAELDVIFQKISQEKKQIMKEAEKMNDAQFQEIEILNEVKENNNHIENKLINLNF